MNEPYSREEADLLVKMAYELILLRSPEPQGATMASESLQSGTADLRAFFQSLLYSEEFAIKQAQFLTHYVKPQLRQLFLDHSQNGEFKLILQFLIERGHHDQIIVDVGARGRDRSNSYDLLRHFGWRGLLIEANPRLVESIREEFAGTNFVVESAAVSNYEGRADLFFGVNDDISSLIEAATAGWGEVKGKTRVEVWRLSTILEKHEIPASFDILSLDIEGEDIRTFNELIGNSLFRPRLVIIEVGEAAEIRDLAARGFSAEVAHEYEIWDSCGPNLFLARI